MLRTSLNVAYMVLAGVIIIGLVLIFVLFQPMLRTISETNTKIHDTEQGIVEREEFIQTIHAKTLELERSNADERILAAALPTVDGEEDVLRILHQAASISGSVITSAANQTVQERRNIQAAQASQGSQTTEGTAVTPLGIEVTVKGTYQQIRQFIGFVERSVRLLDVTTMDMRHNQEAGESLTVTLGVRFYKEEPATVPFDSTL